MKRFKKSSGEILEQYTLNKSLGNGENVYGLPLKGSREILTRKESCPRVEEPDSLCGKCDELLQEYHRFDEGIGLDGKWAGGSVTGVCRGWGSTKVRTELLLSCTYSTKSS